MEHKMKCELGEDQLGYNKNVGAREAMLTLHQISENRHS